MSFLKKPFQKFKDRGSRNSGDFSEGTPKDNGANGAQSPILKDANGGAETPDSRRVSKELLREQKVRRSMDKERLKIEAMKRAQLSRIESETFMRTGPPDLTKLYRPYSMNMSKNWNHENRVQFKDIDFASMCHPLCTSQGLNLHILPLRRTLKLGC